MDNQVKVVLLVRSAQLPSHMVCFIGRTRDMHLPAIWSEEMSYPFPSVMAQVRMVVVSPMRCYCRACWRVCTSIKEGMWGVRHLALTTIR
jgi:hypothetical protein